MEEVIGRSKNWKDWENQGDDLWERAFLAQDMKTVVRNREQALKCYAQAHTALPPERLQSTDSVRLCWKKARGYRKARGGSSSAAEELKEAYETLKALQENDVLETMERAHVELEAAYQALANRNFKKALADAARVMTLAQQVVTIQRSPSRLILGDAYNIIGIALDQGPKLQSSVYKSPEYCWDQAERHYMGEGAAGQRGIWDVEVNRAARVQRQGYFRKSIDLLHKVLNDLPLERKLIVQHDLANAHLEAGNGTEALNQAKSNLAEATRAGDVLGQILAREVTLKALHMRLADATGTVRSERLYEAVTVYNEALTDLRHIRQPDPRPYRLELHRIMVEVYLMMGDGKSAQDIVDLVDKEGALLPDEDGAIENEEQADWQATLALLEANRGKSRAALARWERAYSFYVEEDLPRQAIEAGLQQVKLYLVGSQKDNVERVSRILYEILGLALGARRDHDVNRVQEMIDSLPNWSGSKASDSGHPFDYQRGLRILRTKLPASAKLDLDVLAFRMSENLTEKERYSDSDSARRDRAMIVDSINRLAQEHLSISYVELCYADHTRLPDQ